MNRTKIEWTDYVWNPIKGLCPNDCWYCYARKIYERFGWDTEMKIAEEYPNMIFMPLYDRKKEIISRKVFVCSTFELFHPEVPKSWRDWIFDNIEYNSNLTFQILTKFPQNIDRPMPDNVWLGVTVTGIEDEDKLCELWKQKAKLKFVSFEPLLLSIHFSFLENLKKYVDWVIVGRLTGYGNKHNPKLYDIVEIRHATKVLKIPLFLKDNLKDIWGDKLIQEFPKEEK